MFLPNYCLDLSLSLRGESRLRKHPLELRNIWNVHKNDKKRGGEKMNRLFTKVAVGIATGALLAVTAVPSAFASSAVGVGGNGAFSSNDVDVNNSCSAEALQANNTAIQNAIRNYASTGGNSANFNTGGSVVIYTGDATAVTDVSNAAGSNALAGMNGCGFGSTGVSVNSNGAFSNNTVDVSNWSREQWRQYNETAFLNSVYNSMVTGGNSANFNTGSDILIYTGNAASGTSIDNQAGSNVLQ